MNPCLARAMTRAGLPSFLRCQGDGSHPARNSVCPERSAAGAKSKGQEVTKGSRFRAAALHAAHPAPGEGSGIGSGRGPGLGPGSGGGTGGGVYRPGGSVTAPRVITEVKPTYTSDALRDRIQGTIVLELIVRRNGHPSDIHVIRSVDPRGLDEEAIATVAQWRFEPGRLAGTPVDVLVTVMPDFWIR